MTLLLPSGAYPYALLPATTATIASVPALRLVESDAAMPRYKFSVGRQVFVTSYSVEWDFRKQCVHRVPKERQAQIKSRKRLKNLRTGEYENWYVVAGYPFMYCENDVSLRARYYQPPQTRMQAVAAA